MAFLIDAGWMGVIVGVVTIALTIVIYLIGRNKKALSYEILSESPLISISDEIKGNLQVLFNGEPVENIHLLLVKVVNNGNTPIAISDYERPLSLRFKDASNIISAENTEVTPDNLSPSINISGQALTVEPLMLNSGDSFTIKILVRQYSSKFDVDARVLGVKAIRMLSKNDRGLRVIVTGLIMEIAVPVTLIAVGVALFSFVAGKVNEYLLPPQLNIHAIEMDRYILRERETAKLIPVISTPTLGPRFDWIVERGRILGTGDTPGMYRYYAPDTPGSDTVTLKITDRVGNASTKSITIEIIPREPQASSSKSISEGVIDAEWYVDIHGSPNSGMQRTRN